MLGTTTPQREEEFWLSTHGLLAVLLFWERYQRADRRRATRDVTRLFLGLTCLPDDLPCLKLQEFDAEFLQRCNKQKDDRGVCQCLVGVEASIVEERAAILDDILSQVRSLAGLTDCPAAMAHCRWILDACAAAIFAQRRLWASSDYLEDPELKLRTAAGNSRRKDIHAVRALVNRERFVADCGANIFPCLSIPPSVLCGKEHQKPRDRRGHPGTYAGNRTPFRQKEAAGYIIGTSVKFRETQGNCGQLTGHLRGL